MSGAPIPSGSGSELDRLRKSVATYFPVYETRVGPQSVMFAVHVDPASLAAKFDGLRQELGRLGYIPVLRKETGEEFVEVLRRPRFGPRRPWVNVALLAATVGTTVFAGTMLWVSYLGKNVLGPSDVLFGAIYFAFPLLLILGVHESAHFFVARRYHLDASLPYFIPLPPPLIIGTFGAFVSIREPFPDRKTLFDVGAAGPLAGFAVALPIALAGLSLSVHAPVVPANYCGLTVLGQNYGDLQLGASVFWLVLTAFFPASIVSLHPLAVAGWVGVLVTAINLVPAGSLDGGHVFRAMFGERSRYVSYAAAAMLFGLGFVYIGWILFALVVFLIGLRHPAPLNDTTHLDWKRVAAGVGVAAILLSGFALVPLSTPTGQMGLDRGHVQAITPPSGRAIAADLTVNVTNRDPSPHGLLFGYSVESVWSSNTTILTGVALLRWEQNASWTFLLPNGTRLGPFPGGSASLPAAEYLVFAGSAKLAATAEFSDNETAYMVSFSFQATELCPPAGGSAGELLPGTTFS